MADTDAYLVAIKPSAWRSSPAAGSWVNHSGPTREFRTKALAREWARECSGPQARLWIQDAVPWDGSDADGYLVGVTRGSSTGSEDAAGTQATLPGSENP